MKQGTRIVAWTLGAALVVGGLAGQVNAADRRPTGSEPVALTATPMQPSPAERLMATRRDFRAVVVDTGLASADVAELIERAEEFASLAGPAMLFNPEQFHGMTMEELVARKMQPVFATKGLDDATITHLTALVLNWTNQQVELEYQMPTGGVVAPTVEGSPR